MAVGSETDGSITCPASLNGCVGIKPTVGSVPREKMIPISASQDSPGPMAQTVDQTVALLEVMMNKSGLLKLMNESDGLKIGVVKNWLTSDSATDALFENALKAISLTGIKLVEVTLEEPSEEVGNDEYAVLKHELFSDLGEYLKNRRGSRVKSLADVVAFNTEFKNQELQFFQQEIFDEALLLGGRNEIYEKHRARNLEWANNALASGLAEVDVLIGCTYSPAWESRLGEGDDFGANSWITTVPSIAGAPIGTVPMGVASGLPVGLGVVAARNDEVALVRGMALIERALGLGVLKPTFIKSA
jgi:amidase